MEQETKQEFYNRKVRETEEAIRVTEAEQRSLAQQEGKELIRLSLVQPSLDEAEEEHLADEIQRRALANKETISRLGEEIFKLEAQRAYFSHQRDRAAVSG